MSEIERMRYIATDASQLLAKNGMFYSTPQEVEDANRQWTRTQCGSNVADECTIKKIGNIVLGISLATLLSACSASGMPPKNVDLQPQLKNFLIASPGENSRYMLNDEREVPLFDYKTSGR